MTTLNADVDTACAPEATSRARRDDAVAAAGVRAALAAGSQAGAVLADAITARTVSVDPTVDEDAFFSTQAGEPTLVTRYDLEQTIPAATKSHLTEVDRYWVNKPYAFVFVGHSTRENEPKYYVVQPHLTELEQSLLAFLRAELRRSIPYDETTMDDDTMPPESIIVDETMRLLERYGLTSSGSSSRAAVQTVLDRVPFLSSNAGVFDSIGEMLGVGSRDVAMDRDTTNQDAVTDRDTTDRDTTNRDATTDRDNTETDVTLPTTTRAAHRAAEPVDPTLSPQRVDALLYYLRREFTGTGRIDPITHDVRVEDISCDGYDSPVFVYHVNHGQVITNVQHGRDELDRFVISLAQRAEKGISKRRPQVDATLPDGSRAQLTLGDAVADRGTNYTIRQVNDVPFTPLDLIHWGTFSLDQMAFLWLCIEHNKNVLFAGGTASGKTTCLNAVSIFIPSNAKIVSIEDTREVELPQRNWIASVTRQGLATDETDAVDEFDLLEAALRQRPDYILVGEVRGEEGRTAFQVMSTGHTTCTTFHADSVDEVIKRFTTDPIRVSKTMFTALDLVCIQTSTRVGGERVRRNASITEINHYDAEHDEINVTDVFRWHAETDAFQQADDPSVLETIAAERGWDRSRLQDELDRRRKVLAYLIEHDHNSYAEVTAAVQAFMSDPAAVMSLIDADALSASLADLQTMESIHVDVDATTEAMTPRPTPTQAVRAEARAVLSDTGGEPSRQARANGRGDVV